MALKIEYQVNGIESGGYRVVSRHTKSLENASKLANEIAAFGAKHYSWNIVKAEIVAERYTPKGHRFIDRAVIPTFVKPDFPNEGA